MVAKRQVQRWRGSLQPDRQSSGQKRHQRCLYTSPTLPVYVTVTEKHAEFNVEQDYRRGEWVHVGNNILYFIIMLKHQLWLVLFHSSFSSILRHISVRPWTKNVKAPPTILTNKHTSEAEGSLDTFPHKVDGTCQDWRRTRLSGGDDRRNKPYASLKFIQLFSNQEIKEKLAAKTRGKVRQKIICWQPSDLLGSRMRRQESGRERTSTRESQTGKSKRRARALGWRHTGPAWAQVPQRVWSRGAGALIAVWYDKSRETCARKSLYMS